MPNSVPNFLRGEVPGPNEQFTLFQQLARSLLGSCTTEQEEQDRRDCFARAYDEVLGGVDVKREVEDLREKIDSLNRLGAFQTYRLDVLRRALDQAQSLIAQLRADRGPTPDGSSWYSTKSDWTYRPGSKGPWLDSEKSDE